jgi:predicted nucleic acid-binding protein
VSAFIAGGPPSRIIEEAVDDNLDLVLLEPAMVKLVRILAEKLGFTVERLKEVQALLADIAIESHQTPSREPEALTGDPDDDLVLACAVEARVDALVSGDRKHLIPIGEHRGVRILTPQAFLAELRV